MALDDYITAAMLSARLSPQVMQSIYDDLNVGIPDTAAVNRLIADACAKVNGYLFPVYEKSMTLSSWASPYPAEVVRLTLDVAFAFAAQRHPEAVKRDWQPLMAQAEKELDGLRSGKTRLNLPSLPPEQNTANAGGVVHSGSSVDPATLTPRFFADGTGDF